MKQSFTFTHLSRVLVVLGVVFFTLQLNAQVFQKSYMVQGFSPGSHHFTESVTRTTDGQFVMLGWNLADVLFPKMTLVKIDQYSDITWRREYNRCASMVMGSCILEDFSAFTYGTCVQQTSDGGFIMTGSLNDRMLLMKTNANGSTVTWARTYGNNSYGWFVRQTSDGGYIAVGSSRDFEGTKSGSNVFVVKTNSNGVLQWDRVYRFSSTYNDVATSVDQLSGGDFVISGYSTQIFANGDTTSDIILMRLNSTGNLVFANTYGLDNRSEEAWRVSKTTDGGYILAGHTTDASHALSSSDAFLWKFNSANTPEFRYSYKVSDFFSLSISFGYAAQQTQDGGYALFGVTTGIGFSISYFNNYVLKLDNQGTPEFCKSYRDSVSGGASINLGWTIWNDGQQLPNGGYLIGGSGIPMSGAGLGYKLIKTNPVGESGCSENTVTPTQYNFAPAAKPITPPNISTGSSSSSQDMIVKTPTIIAEFICYETCTALPGNDTTICAGGSVQLGGGGPNGETAINGTPPYTYSWSSNPPGFNSAVEKPTVTPTVTTTYTLTITDSDLPACVGTASIVVTISPQPSIHGVTATPQIICEGTSSELHANSNHATTFAWSPATTPNNTQTVTASPVATTTYTVTASNPCGSVSANVTVTVVPSPQINLPPNDTICEGETYTVTGSLSNYQSISWSTSGTGTFSNTTSPNPVYTPSADDVTAGSVTLSVEVIANSVTCSDSIVNIELAIMPIPPAPTFDNTLPSLCANDAPIALSGGTPVGGTYSGPGVANNMFNPTTAGAGTHTLTYTISEFGCENSATNSITVIPIPIVSLNGFDNICISDEPLNLFGGTPANGTYTGEFVANGIFDPLLAGDGQHTIAYIYTDSIGCSDTATVTITVVPDVVLTSNAPDNAVYVDLGQVVNFTAAPANAGTYVYAVDNTQVQSGNSNTYATNTLQAGNVVYVTLNEACQDSIIINVKPVPNAFVPFTLDGSNDLFMPNVDLTIVNRWGQELYQGTSGWDGTYKGQNVSPGTYFYIIKIVDLTGTEKQITGTVTLVSKN